MTKVLFACVQNAGRSQMAAAFFNALADPRKATAISAGTAPGDKVHPEVQFAMQSQGVDLAGATPQLLTPALADTAQWLITMGCGDECPLAPAMRREDWQLDDPKGRSAAEVARIRDEIKARVQTFIAREGWLKESIAFRT